MIDFNIRFVEEKLMSEVPDTLRERLHFNTFRKEAYELLTQTPDCLKRNIEEWLLGQPLTDILYCGLTYNQFLQKAKFDQHPDKISLCTFWYKFSTYLLYAESGQKHTILKEAFPWLL